MFVSIYSAFSKHNSESITLAHNLSQVLCTLDWLPKYNMTYAYCLRQRVMIFVDTEDFVRALCTKSRRFPILNN